MLMKQPVFSELVKYFRCISVYFVVYRYISGWGRTHTGDSDQGFLEQAPVLSPPFLGRLMMIMLQSWKQLSTTSVEHGNR